MNKDLSINNMSRQECADRVLTATMMAHSLSCCLERKYLDSIALGKESLIEIVKNDANQELTQPIAWLKLEQVGHPISNDAQQCFGYLQKILMSGALPFTEMTFLVIGDGEKATIYLGQRDLTGESSRVNSSVSALSHFSKICWPGLNLEAVSPSDETLKSFYTTQYNYATAITGIPTTSFSKEDGNSNIEHLIGGMNGKRFAYIVTARPLDSGNIDDVLYQCREMGGQIESMKSINISESVQKGSSKAYSKAKALSKQWSESHSIQKKNYKDAAGKALLGAGLYMAAGAFFPPAIAILPGLQNAFVGAMSMGGSLSAFFGLSGLSGMNILSGFVPTRTDQKTEGGSETETITRTTTFSESTSQSLSETIVNKHASAAAKQIDQQIDRFSTAKGIGAWEVGCVLLSEEPALHASMQLKSILSGTGSSMEPIRIHDITAALRDGSENYQIKGFTKSPHLLIKYKDFTDVEGREHIGEFFHHPLGDCFSNLSTILTTKELTALINFPLHTVPGIKVVESAPEFPVTPQKKVEKDKKNLQIGKMLYGGVPSNIDVVLPLNTLSRHILVAGVNGSGKTNTVLSILKGFSDVKRPFFVIEPAKTEYVDWAIEYNKAIREFNKTANEHERKKEIKIFIPGCERYAKEDLIPEKLRVNPFEVIQLCNSEPRVLSHIDRLRATFASAFPMQDILPVIIEHLLYDLYTNVHQMIEKDDWTNYMKNGVPTLTDVNQIYIEKFMREIGYAKENTQNISAALRTRFTGLKQGWKGELLNNDKLALSSWDEKLKKFVDDNNFSWKDLFDTPVVVNLSYAGDDQDKAFIMSLLLQFLYEYRIAESESVNFSFNANECRHLVVVEEAHRVMGRCDNPEAPQYRSGQMFSNFLSEVRAYGQGMMVVDQVPTRLIEDAIKNTNVKIIHKLVASDDSRVVAECIGLTADQQRVIPKLSIGQAVLAGFNSANVMSNDSSDIYLAQINKMK